jgi:hypothetical protein
VKTFVGPSSFCNSTVLLHLLEMAMHVTITIFNVLSDVVCPNHEDDSFWSRLFMPSELPFSGCQSPGEMKYSKRGLPRREVGRVLFQGHLQQKTCARSITTCFSHTRRWGLLRNTRCVFQYGPSFWGEISVALPQTVLSAVKCNRY